MARGHSRFVRPAPRTKMWIGAGVGSTTLSSASKHFVAQLSAGALLLRPFTILRTHILVNLRTDQLTATENLIASYGHIVVTDTAAAIGVTAVPDPSGIAGDPEADWFVWQAMFNSFFIDINGTDGIGVDGNNGVTYTIDSKAMRKVGPDDDVINMCTMTSSVGGILTTQGRRLIQLH